MMAVHAMIECKALAGDTIYLPIGCTPLLPRLSHLVLSIIHTCTEYHIEFRCAAHAETVWRAHALKQFSNTFHFICEQL